MTCEQFIFSPTVVTNGRFCFLSNDPGIQRREPGADLRGRGDRVRHLVAERQRLRHRGVLVLHLDPAGVQRAQRERRQAVSSRPPFPFLSRADDQRLEEESIVLRFVFAWGCRTIGVTALSRLPHDWVIACPGYIQVAAFSGYHTSSQPHTHVTARLAYPMPRLPHITAYPGYRTSSLVHIQVTARPRLLLIQATACAGYHASRLPHV